MKLFLERNSLTHFSLVLLSIFLGCYISWPFFFLWIGVQLIDDLFYYSLGFSIFDPEIRIQRGYQFANVFLESPSGEGRDLGFNLYDGDLTKDQRQAQIDKWEFVLSELNLTRGDSLIDIGCGYGDWLNYAKSKGINVTGINLTQEQATEATKRYGIEVICINWKDINKNQELKNKLYKKFDAVTFMDSPEHFLLAKHRNDLNAQSKIYSDMFKLSADLLKPTSNSHKIFISCLHRKPQSGFSLREAMVLYLLDKYHSGCYPMGDHGLTRNALPYFIELKRFDKTEDYRISSVLDKNHFGAYNIKWNLRSFLHIPALFFLDPHHIHKWIDIYVNGSMWWHFGEYAWEKTYEKEKHKETSRAVLWWIVLQKA